MGDNFQQLEELQDTISKDIDFVKKALDDNKNDYPSLINNWSPSLVDGEAKKF